MTLPALWSRLDLSIPVKVPGPAAVCRLSGDAYQLRPKVIDLDSISTFAIGYLVQSMAILLNNAVFETHSFTYQWHKCVARPSADSRNCCWSEVAGVQEAKLHGLT